MKTSIRTAVIAANKNVEFPEDKIPRLERWGTDGKRYVGDVFDSPRHKDGTTILISGPATVVGHVLLMARSGPYVLGKHKRHYK